MDVTQAKRLAIQRGYVFQWNANLRMYACYPADAAIHKEASYHTKATLAPMTARTLIAFYLEPLTTP